MTYIIDNKQKAIDHANNILNCASKRYSCQTEMVRDYAKEAQLNDGYTYWRTTGRTVVTWANGAVTYLIRKEMYTYSVSVVDCGYDESLPF